MSSDVTHRRARQKGASEEDKVEQGDVNGDRGEKPTNQRHLDVCVQFKDRSPLTCRLL